MTTVLQNPIAEEDLGAKISHLEMQGEALVTPDVQQAKPTERKFNISILNSFLSVYDLREHVDRYHNYLRPGTVRAIEKYFIKNFGKQTVA